MKLPQIQSQFVAISGGMDLTTSPIAKANGEAIMALNVQPNYGGGFSRIEGYECLDGITTPSKMQHCHLITTRKPPKNAVGKTFTLNDRLCHILAVNPDENRFTIATLEHLDVNAGGEFMLESQRYVMKSATFLDSGDASVYQRFQADAFQIGVDLVQSVPGDSVLRGVVELNEQLIAFRDQTDKCGVFFTNASGWQAGRSTYLVELKDISQPNEIIDGARFIVESQQGEVLSAVLSADDTSGHIVIDFALSPDAQIQINGTLAAKVKRCQLVSLSKGKSWQFVYHNFYGSPKTQYAYGCNGEEVIEVRPNGVIIPIKLPAEKPKHICTHRNHLFVAFDGGNLGIPW